MDLNSTAEHDLVLREKCIEGTRKFRKAMAAAHDVLSYSLNENDQTTVATAVAKLEDAAAFHIEQGERAKKEADNYLAAVKEAQSLLEPKVTLGLIGKYICRKYGIAKEDLQGPGRQLGFVIPRQEFCYLARTLTTKTQNEIGRWLGDRDHATIGHGEKKHKERVMQA